MELDILDWISSIGTELNDSACIALARGQQSRRGAGSHKGCGWICAGQARARRSQPTRAQMNRRVLMGVDMRMHMHTVRTSQHAERRDHKLISGDGVDGDGVGKPEFGDTPDVDGVTESNPSNSSAFDSAACC